MSALRNSAQPTGERAGHLEQHDDEKDRPMASIARVRPTRQQPPRGLSLRPSDCVDDPEWDDFIESTRRTIDGDTGSGVSDEGLRCLADVEPEDVDWLWKPYIPLGKVSIIEGDPGLGKSWLSLGIAASISLGRGLPNTPMFQPRNVLLLSSEDGLGDTIRPRLDAMRANVNRVFAVENVYTFDEAGLPDLEVQIARTSALLVIVDPFVAYFGDRDLNKANQTRKVMAALAEIAERQHCAIVLIRHLTKGSRDKAVSRGQGNIDITAAARSVLLVGADPDDRNKRAVVQIKCNLAEFGPALGYSIEDGRFTWGGVSDLTAGRILAPEGQGGPARIDEAEQFLRDLLSDGPVRQPDVEKQAKANDVAVSTLKRAKRKMNVISRRNGKTGEWVWTLPSASNS